MWPVVTFCELQCQLKRAYCFIEISPRFSHQPQRLVCSRTERLQLDTPGHIVSVL